MSEPPQHPPKGSAASFLPEPFPKVNPANHYHDAYGDGDMGVDYGPPSGLELDDDDDDEETVDEMGITNDDTTNNNNIQSNDDEQQSVMEPSGDESDESHGKVAAVSHHSNDNTIANDDNRTHDNPVTTLSLQELQETVSLHETTLQSLHTKLQTLQNEIHHETTNTTTLRHDLRSLSVRKKLLKKKTEEKVRLVRELEGTLERCLERMRRELLVVDVAAASAGNGAVGVGGGGDADVVDDTNGGHDGGEMISTTEALDAADLTTQPSIEMNGQDVPTSDEEILTDLTTNHQSTIVYNQVPLIFDKSMSITGHIVWPPASLVNQVQSEIDTLSCKFPTWRTDALSTPLLQRVDSATMLADIMNVAVLERLMEREELLKASALPSAECGWVNEMMIWGSPLDVFAQVDWMHLIAGFRRFVGGGHGSAESTPNDDVYDPNAILCPYELGGTCADERCTYQHIHKQRRTQDVVEVARGESATRFLRYYNLPEPRLPPALTRGDFIACEEIEEGDEMQTTKTQNLQPNQPASRVPSRLYLCPTCATKSFNMEALQEHMRQCSQTSMTINGSEVSVTNVLLPRDTATSYGANNANESSSTFVTSRKDNKTKRTEVEDNLDFILLPLVDDVSSHSGVIGGDVSVDGNTNDNSDRLDLANKFWWQPLMAETEKKKFGDTIVMVLAEFGFYQSTRTSEEFENEETGHILQYSNTYVDKDISTDSESTLLIARAVDCSRICIHMGQDLLALTILSSVSRGNLMFSSLISQTSEAIKAISSNRSSCAIFNCQVFLLAISEYFRARHIWLTSLTQSKSFPQPCPIDTLIPLLDKTKPAPSSCGHEKLKKHLMSRVPSKNRSSINADEDDAWEPFVRALQSQFEKYVLTPFSQMTTKDQLPFLLECVYMGRFLGDLVRDLSVEYSTFSPISHVLDPTLTIIQRLLQTTSMLHDDMGCKGWFQADTIGIVLIGPVVFSSVAFAVAVPLGYATKLEIKQGLPQIDSRQRLDVSSLEKFVIDVLKDFKRYRRQHEKGLVEPFLSLLHSTVIAISVTLGSYDKAQMRLENVFNSENKSLHVLSETLWSQFVHLRMTCPSYDISLEEQTLPKEITKIHRRVSSRIISNGIVLRGLNLLGDLSISASCVAISHRTEWHNAVAKIVTRYTNVEAGQTPSNVSFYLGTIGTAENSGYATFPESLLLLGSSLVTLSMTDCGLNSLPLSFGLHLKCLVVSVLASDRVVICFLAKPSLCYVSVAECCVQSIT